MQANNTNYNPINSNQINNNGIQQIPPLQQPTNLSPITKNYGMMPVKAPTHVFTTILLYIVTAVVFFGAGYVTRMWQDSLNSDKATSLIQSPSAVDLDIKSWEEYTYDMLNLNMNHPVSWIATETTEMVDGCTAIVIKITNGDYSFVIDSACNTTIKTCIYNGSNEMDDNSVVFNDFTEVASDTTAYRRALNPDNDFTICVKPQDEYLSYTVPFGYIRYEIPQNYSDEMIAIMDNMLLSLTDSTTSRNNVVSTGCMAESIQYNIGDTFDATDGCNTCTCQQDGNITCTMEECVTPTQNI